MPVWFFLWTEELGGKELKWLIQEAIFDSLPSLLLHIELKYKILDNCAPYNYQAKPQTVFYFKYMTYRNLLLNSNE